MELIVQLVHLFMQVVIVLLGIGQLLLKLNLSSSQNAFFRPGFIPLMKHMDHHALIVPVRYSQPLNLLPSRLIPMEGLIPLQGHRASSACSLSISLSWSCCS
jgi:hypothetical protein